MPMPTKRAILSELTRDELRDNLDFFELEVDDRRVTSQLIDALAGSRKARLDEILPYLSRDRLKELCRAFDLDDSGRRKAESRRAPPQTRPRDRRTPLAVTEFASGIRPAGDRGSRPTG